ncbi:putative membrane protein [Carnobacterium maltaromaticum]|uniref:pyrimidine-nucleoside phosphorylase n=1 Tax=Carnobacterium maltaromaticum TaxID=2751 RepID=UPI00191B9F61|nr:pyrimidine-nucleoside phosphorylase [Carnobacterium maltaromaticum]CAD5901532.1 putative membrane protein [Carnobacterium maltaromaticum]
MLKRIVYGSWFVSLVYFIIYLTMPFLEKSVRSGGIMVYIHVFMDLIFIGGLFFIIVSIIRYFFVDPNK